MATVANICNAALGRIGVRQYINSLQDSSANAQACAVYWPLSLDTITADFWWPFATRRATLAQVAPPYPAWSSTSTYGLNQQVTVSGTPGYFVSLAAGNLNNTPNTAGTAFWQYYSTYTRTGWNYMYALPTDCIEVQELQYQPDLGIAGPYVFSPPCPGPWWMRQQLPNHKVEWVVEADDANDGGQFLLTNLVAGQNMPECKYTGSLQKVGAFPPVFSEALSWLLARDLAMALPNKAEYAKPAEQKYQSVLRTAIARAINASQQQHEPESEFILAR